MQELSSNFSFKENIVIPCFISLFFGGAALLVAYAAFIKLGDGIIWSLAMVLSIVLALFLFYLVVMLVRTRRTVAVSPESLSVTSIAHGRQTINWRDLTGVREVQNRMEKARSAAPLIEVILALYLNLPFLAGIDRRGLLVFESKANQQIAIRQHLIYPHRLDQLQQAVDRYAPYRSKAQQVMKLNINN